MSIIGKIQSLFSDREKTQPIFPITKTKAVSDDNGVSLDVLLEGKAPSGYGLGENAVYLDDFYSSVKSGFYYTDANTKNRMIYCPEYAAVLVVNGVVTGSAYKLVLGKQYSDGFLCVYYTNDYGKTWTSEWINPPMIVGIDYRTIERYKGKPVYVTSISFGALPNNNDTTLYHVRSNVDQVVSVDMETYDVGGTRFGGLLPNVVGYWAGVTTDNEMYLKIKTNADITSYTSHLIVKYTKK